jgi:hypothetical protein|tara:strand:- start:14 stop:733 length:720 start_codon:yes stop_codon:yes gene_type:complete
MPTPSNRTPIRVARGTYSNLNSSIADIQEGEICYATDQNRCYVKEGSSLVSVTPDTSTLAALASPTFTGTPAAPTAAQGTNTTQLATTAFVNAEIASDLTAAIGSTVQAFDADTAKTDVAQAFTKAQRGTPVALTDASSVAVDLSLGNNFTLLCTSSVGSTRALANPTNAVAGQTGLITVTQASGGGNALTFSSNYKFAGGSSAAPSLTTGTGSAVDVLPYTVKSATEIVIGKPLSDVK